MKKSTIKYLKFQTKLIFFFLTLSIIGCGPFNSYNSSTNDGIYASDNLMSNNQTSNNQNGLYYKNYFDQKAQDLGVSTNENDSILTDVGSYSNSNVQYQNSFGSWGDSPSSVNIVNNSYYPNNGFHWSNFYRPYYMNSWYDPFYNPFYSPYYSWNYFPYGRFGYTHYMYRPWFYPRNYGHPYYNGGFYDPNTVAYMNGRRGSSIHGNGFSSNKISSNSSIVNNNVGRNSQTTNKNQSEEKNSRNINRLYYSVNGYGVRSSYQTRDYNNIGEKEIEFGQGSRDIRNNKNANSVQSNNGRSSTNFQLSKYGNSSRESLERNNYNRSSNFGNPMNRSYTAPVRSNNSTIKRSTYSPRTTSIGRTSTRSSSGSSSSSSSSSSRSRSPR